MGPTGILPADFTPDPNDIRDHVYIPNPVEIVFVKEEIPHMLADTPILYLGDTAIAMAMHQFYFEVEKQKAEKLIKMGYAVPTGKPVTQIRKHPNMVISEFKVNWMQLLHYVEVENKVACHFTGDRLDRVLPFSKDPPVILLGDTGLRMALHALTFFITKKKANELILSGTVKPNDKRYKT